MGGKENAYCVGSTYCSPWGLLCAKPRRQMTQSQRMSIGGMKEVASDAIADEVDATATAACCGRDDDVDDADGCAASDAVMACSFWECACAPLDCADANANCADADADADTDVSSCAVVRCGGSNEDSRRATWRRPQWIQARKAVRRPRHKTRSLSKLYSMTWRMRH